MSAVVIETERVRVEWRAPHALSLDVTLLRPGASVETSGGGGDALREETTYGVLVQARGAARSVAVRHPDPVVTRDLQASSDGRTVHGTVAMRSQVGTLRLVVEADGRPELAVAADVAPTKVDAATVAQMRDEVEAAVAGLAVRYLRATTVPAAATEAPTSGGGWLRLVEAALDVLEPALAHVARAPVRDTERVVHAERAAAIRRPDAAVRQAVRTGRGYGPRVPLGDRSVRRRLPTRRAVLSLDTAEHRWLRSALDHAARRLHALGEAERATRPSARRAARLDALHAAEARLHAMRRLEPLAAAALGAPPAPTLRLRRAPGYRAAYDAARLLRFGLDLGAGRLRTSLVDLFALYEQWAYLAVVEALTRRLGPPLDTRRLFAARAHGLRLRLLEGAPHALRFATGEGGTVRLAYQPRFGRPGLLPQRPDLLLTVERAGLPTRRYVLDAKYRRDDAPATVRRFGLPAPPADALADLHRYRDAIRDRLGQRIIDEAVALYPFAPADPDAVAASRLWRSIEALGVGAIPLLPKKTQHLDAWLRRVLR